jgi:hypothetical protein
MNVTKLWENEEFFDANLYLMTRTDCTVELHRHSAGLDFQHFDALKRHRMNPRDHAAPTPQPRGDDIGGLVLSPIPAGGAYDDREDAKDQIDTDDRTDLGQRLCRRSEIA